MANARMPYGLNESDRTAIFSSNNRFKFCLLVVGSILFSTAYTLLQERLYSRDRSFPAPHGWLTFVTLAVYSILALFEIAMLRGGSGSSQYDRLPVYAGVAALVVIAMYITNVALHQGVKYSFQQISAALVLVLGLGLFLAADSVGTGSHQNIATVGVLMLIFSVLLDALTSNVEEKSFFRTLPAATRTEVIAYVSSFASLYCILPLVYSGEWASVWQHSAAIPTETWLNILLSAAAGYGAMSFMLMLIEHCGVATAEIVKNLRKILQVGCSFLFFPKPLSWMHVFGGVLVVGGMCLFMQRPKHVQQKVRQSPKVIDMSSEAVQPFQDFRPTDFRILAVHHNASQSSFE